MYIHTHTYTSLDTDQWVARKVDLTEWHPLLVSVLLLKRFPLKDCLQWGEGRRGLSLQFEGFKDLATITRVFLKMLK